MPTASLIVSVAAATSGTAKVLVAGITRLVAGAMSMAANESAAPFTVSAALPLAMVLISPDDVLPWAVSAASLLFLAALGALAA